MTGEQLRENTKTGSHRAIAAQRDVARRQDYPEMLIVAVELRRRRAQSSHLLANQGQPATDGGHLAHLAQHLGDDRIAPRRSPARLVVVPRAGHLSPLENPRAVNRMLRSFLQEIEAKTPPARRPPVDRAHYAPPTKSAARGRTAPTAAGTRYLLGAEHSCSAPHPTRLLAIGWRLDASAIRPARRPDRPRRRDRSNPGRS